MIAGAITGLGAWAWIVLGLALIGLELMAPGVFLLWLGLAAIVTGVFDAALDLSWQASCLVFAALSVASVVLGRMIMRPTSQPDTQADFLNQRGQALVGRVFTLETPIKDGEGRIRVDDSSWRVTGADLPAGNSIRIVRVDGTTLVVESA